MKTLSKLTLGLILITTGGAIYAAANNCPPATAFSHTPGKSWQLNAKYRNQWVISADVNTVTSKLTQLKTNNQSLAYLSARPNTDPVACYYNVAKNSNIILNTDSKAFSLAGLQQIVQTNKHFNYGYGNNGLDKNYIVCSANNGTVNNLCRWS